MNPRYCVIARYSKPSECGKNVRWMTSSFVPLPIAHDVLTNPQSVLSKLCEALGIPWDIAMLSWPPGRRDTDGPWAPHWYGAVEASTGFGPPETDAVELPADAQRVADRCRPYYERLAEHRLTP